MLASGVVIRESDSHAFHRTGGLPVFRFMVKEFVHLFHSPAACTVVLVCRQLCFQVTATAFSIIVLRLAGTTAGLRDVSLRAIYRAIRGLPLSPLRPSFCRASPVRVSTSGVSGLKSLSHV